METRIEIAHDDASRLDELRETLGTLEGVRDIRVDEAARCLVVDHDEDVITAEELISKAGSEGEVVTDDEQQGSTAGSPQKEASPADQASELPRTTTTGDDTQDLRSEGAGAEQEVPEKR